MTERDAGQVESHLRTAALAQPPRGEHGRDQANGTLSQKIQCQSASSVTAPPTSGPGRDRQPRQPAGDADDQPAPPRRERGRQERQRERHEDGRREALDGARGDSSAVRCARAPRPR